MVRWNRHYFNHRERVLRGQAILELAVFGSILIMLLGVLINYGLRYSHQQQMMQKAFRKAMASAAATVHDGTPISVSHMLIEDKHIPNPADPFAVGSVIPTSSGASLTRNYKMQETPDNEVELPQVAIDIQGQTLSFKAAGFREEEIDENSMDRYKEIYGDGNVWEIGAGVTPDTVKIRIIDSCAGEIINYDSAVRQCRQIVDEDACIKECARGSGNNCSSICSKPMNIPWYCANYREIDPLTHQYSFLVLEQVFSANPNREKGMGLQEDYTQIATAYNKLEKNETTSGITTTDTLDVKVDTTRAIIYKTYGDTSTSTNRQEVVSTVSENKTRQWQRDW